ncbi:MAG TPA: hypothetical protein VLT56_00875, partial [Desulfobacterales bacterium]|nr:hypothetical protein [Desulfobacterales bacterium]
MRNALWFALFPDAGTDLQPDEDGTQQNGCNDYIFHRIPPYFFLVRAAGRAAIAPFGNRSERPSASA